MNTEPDKTPDIADSADGGSESGAKPASSGKQTKGGSRSEDAFVDPAKPKGDKPERSKTEPAKVKPKTPKREKRSVGLLTVCFAALIAAGLGAAGGGALSRVLDQDGPAFQPAQITQRLNALEADIEAIKVQSAEPAGAVGMSEVQALATRIEALENMPIGDSDSGLTSADLAAVSVRLDTLDKAMSGIGARQNAMMQPDPRLVELETKVSALADKPLTDPALEKRIAALETAPVIEAPTVDLVPLTERLQVLEAAAQTMPELIDIAPMTARLEALEAKVASASAARAALPVPAFPKDAVLAAITASDNASKGWVGRMLGKHVRTRDEAVVRLVDQIDILASQGQFEAALSRVQELPRAGQAAAQNWTDIVSLQRTLP